MDDPQYRTEDGSAVRVFTDTVKNDYQSEKEGRPLFDECIYVEVISPGSKGSMPCFLVERIFCEEAGHPAQRSEQYKTYEKFVEAFKGAREHEDLRGTPLTEWPEISRSMAASLKASNIHTVEALANLHDNRLGAVGMDGRAWREKAIAWLDAAKNGGDVTKYVAELERNKDELADKDRQIAELGNRVAELEEQMRAKNTPAAPPPAPATTGTMANLV